MSCSMTEPTKWHMQPAKTQISLGICPVWSESSLTAQLVAKNPKVLDADSEDSSDWVDAHADPSLCWFCHASAHIIDMRRVMRKAVYAICKHSRSLISTFVVRCWDSTIPILATSKISRLGLASVAEQAGLSLGGRLPKTGFLVSWLIYIWTMTWENLSSEICDQVKIWATSRENLSSGFATRSDSNQPAQLQRLARVLKF